MISAVRIILAAALGAALITVRLQPDHSQPIERGTLRLH
jgi:hypothetical protein